MKVNERVQLAILVCLYLSRSGKTEVSYISEHFKYSRQYVTSICKRLERKGIVQMKKNGSYEISLKSDPTISDITIAIKNHKFISFEERRALSLGEFEHRAYITYIDSILNPSLNIKISTLGGDQSTIEKDLFDKVLTVN